MKRARVERAFRSRLPTYHRLDLSVERTFRMGVTALTLQGSLINAYDRRNVSYYDTLTDQRVDQLPIIPSFELRMSVR